MAKVTGIGGVFFKSNADNKALAQWYQKHLGLPLEDFGGAIFRWPDDRAEDQGLTVWHVAAKDSQWFSPSNSSFMIRWIIFFIFYKYPPIIKKPNLRWVFYLKRK